jgi:hypothetical protein
MPAPGYGHVADLAKSYSVEAVDKLAALMRASKSEAIQYAASIALLDRAWGRPQQTIQLHDSEPPVHYYSSREIHDELVRRGLASVLGLSMPKVIEATAIEPRPRSRKLELVEQDSTPRQPVDWTK